MPMADDEDGNAQKADINPATIKIDWHASRTEWIDRIEAQLTPLLAASVHQRRMDAFARA
ncbi:hypothetical protein D3877_06180 [Azospirillum cavernae]|uniref:Uncharacterized protein n=1 Tax=Azospirillum cavernae TaxID=2320860 RepID=A0A418W2H1_9PROT|nr:hypothetical protein [Azospirillum cavernae]RJF84179.1 hypothetical protein D3877_06180 [Azospirillum cavernae]